MNATVASRGMEFWDRSILRTGLVLRDVPKPARGHELSEWEEHHDVQDRGMRNNVNALHRTGLG